MLLIVTLYKRDLNITSIDWKRMIDKSSIRNEILKEIGTQEELKRKMLYIMTMESLSWTSLGKAIGISDGTIRMLARTNFDISVCAVTVLLKIKKFLDSRKWNPIGSVNKNINRFFRHQLLDFTKAYKMATARNSIHETTHSRHSL